MQKLQVGAKSSAWALAAAAAAVGVGSLQDAEQQCAIAGLQHHAAQQPLLQFSPHSHAPDWGVTHNIL
jgi:hypothetical protein